MFVSVKTPKVSPEVEISPEDTLGTSCRLIPIEKNRDWFDAIMTDDAEKIQEILKSGR